MYCRLWKKKRVEVFWNYLQMHNENMMKKTRLDLVLASNEVNLLHCFAWLWGQKVVGKLSLKITPSKQNGLAAPLVIIYDKHNKLIITYRYVKMGFLSHLPLPSHKISVKMARKQDLCHYLQFLLHRQHSHYLELLKTRRSNLKHFLIHAS